VLKRQSIYYSWGYLGANLYRVVPGDEVLILFGCRTPVVLRKVEGGYRLVGSVNVRGVMNGEAMNEFERGGRRADDVVIV
jgi:hypothetical protein